MNIIRLNIVFLATISFAFSQQRYELPDGTILDSVVDINGSLSGNAMTILGLTLGSSTLNDAMSVFGLTENQPRTDDPHESDMICYRSLNDPNICLSFSAGWPENPTDKLTSFRLSRAELFRCKKECSPSSRLISKTGTANGLQLGLTQEGVKALLGVPSRVTQKWMIYSYETYRAYTDNETRKMPLAPGGGQYKGEWSYYHLVARFSKGKMDFLNVSVGGEPSW